MIRVFFDSSALFAAVYSPHGAAGELLRLALRGELKVVVSAFVLGEVAENLQETAPSRLPYLSTLIDALEPEVVPKPTQAELLAAAEFTVLKDAPIIAAAINARPDYLATFDRKHLIDPPEVSARSGLKIVLPEIALDVVRQQSNLHP